MKSLNLAAPKRKRRATLIALVSVGMLSAAGTGSILLGLTGNTDAVVAKGSVQTAGRNDLNIDSLYAAEVAETTTIDTSFAQPISPNQTLNGHVSWYGPGFYGRRTANGERFSREAMTVAHRTLPFGTIIRIVDTQTNKAILARVNDRGPFCRGRLLDMSEAAASKLGVKGRGTATVRVEVFNDGATSSTLTFNGDGQAVTPHGFSVRVGEFQSFDDAYSLQQRLNGDGERKAFLTEIRADGKITYQVSVGLFSSQRLCQSLAADMGDEFAASEVVKFKDGGVQRFELASNEVADN